YGQPQGYGQPPPVQPQQQPSHDPQAFAATAYAGSSFAQQAQQYVQQYHQNPNTQAPYAQPQGFAQAPVARAGMPSIMCFVFGILAVAVALGFDVLFLKIDIPGAGGYVWYATTALSFAGAGFGSAMWTRAGRGFITGVIIATGIVYGASDVGLALVLDDVSLVEAISLAGVGVVIAVGAGLAGAYRAWRQRAD